MTVTGAGSPEVSAVTGAPGPGEGVYSLTGFGLDSYVITPSKAGGQNTSISSFDAARIAQFVVGSVTFSAAEQIVADVSGAGGISSFDAALVGKYAVSTPGSGQAGNWRFDPPSNTHAAITGDINGEDYSALLMGEVSGNWLNTGARQALRNGPERTTVVTAPRLGTIANGEVLIPVSVEGSANKGIISYEFDLRYDPSVIQPQADPVDVAGTVSRGLSVVSNASEAGFLRVAVYGAMPIDADGLLLILKFTAVGTAGSASPLTWERFVFNDGDPNATFTDGQAEPTSPTADQSAARSSNAFTIITPMSWFLRD